MNKEFWKNRRVFITGHTGFKGSWLSLLLTRYGAIVWGYSNTIHPTTPALYDLCNGFGVYSVTGNINDQETLSKAMAAAKPTHIIHMAAQAIVKDGYTDPVGTFKTNTLGTLNLLQACRENPSVKTILIVTTDKVYGEDGSIWGYRERDPVKAADPYSTSKACADLITQCYQESFFRKFNQSVSIARAGNVIGGGDFNYRVIPMTMEYLMKGEKPPIWDPTARRPWQNVLDCLAGYLTLMEYANENMTGSGAWNFGPPVNECETVGEVVDKICALWDGGIVTWNKSLCPVRYNLGTTLRLDPQKANLYLDWYPKWKLGKTIEELVKWYKAYNDGENVRDICERTIEEWENS